MNVLSLFAGVGGLDLGLERAGLTVVGQVEIDSYCQRVLAKHWPEVPRHDDVRSATTWWLDGTPRPAVDIIAGGFPCQDISTAGRRAGIGGERSGLWKPMRDTIRDLRPRFVLLENVTALLVRGVDVVVGDLAEIGYDARWDCIPASAVGAPHRRDRWWCLATDSHRERRRPDVGDLPAREPDPARRGATMADTDGERRGERSRTCRVGTGRPQSADRGAVADTDRAGLHAGGRLGRTWPPPVRDGWWAAEPGMGGAPDGLPARLDRAVAEPWERGIPRTIRGLPDRAGRLRGLGNAVVPQVAEHVGRMLLQAAGVGA